MLQHDFIGSIYAQKFSNVAELKQFCKENWYKMFLLQYKRLIGSYCKHLTAVVSNCICKGARTFSQY